MDHRIIEARYATWRPVQSRKLLQLVFEVPLEKQGEVLKYLGAPLPDRDIQCAIAVLNGEAGEPPVNRAPSKTAPASPTKRSFDDLPYSQQAALKCQDAAFQKFITEREPKLRLASFDDFANDPEERAKQITAEIVRRFCGVESRSEILPESDAGDKWNSLMDEYYLWQQDW